MSTLRSRQSYTPCAADSVPVYWSRRADSIAAFDAGILKGILRQPR
jgi:hypothetical protein